MKSVWKRSISLFLCMMLMMAVPFFAAAEEAAEEAAEVPNVTELLKQHTKLDLTPYLGQTVLLNFFTEWCPYCMQEMPDLKAVSEMYDADSFEVVFVHPWQNEDAQNTENVKAKYGLEGMTFFEDEDSLVTSIIGVPGFPTSVFLNPDGTIAGAAPFMLTLDQLTMQLDQMGVPREAGEE